MRAKEQMNERAHNGRMNTACIVSGGVVAVGGTACTLALFLCFLALPLKSSVVDWQSASSEDDALARNAHASVSSRLWCALTGLLWSI